MKKLTSYSLVLALVALIAFAFTSRKATNYKVDVNKSTIVWLGKKVTGEHTGNIKVKSGVLQHDGKVITGGAFDIDMNSISNTDLTNAEYNQKLVGHLKSDDFFGVDKFPVASFKITSITFKGGDQYELG